MDVFKQIKNKLGKRINPATEDTLAGIKNKTDQLTFDSDSNTPKNLEVNIAGSINLGVSNSGNGMATKATLDAIQNKTSSLTFDNTSSLVTSGVAPTLADAVQIKDVTQTTTNEISNEKIILLRRMVKLMESKGTISAANQITIGTISSGFKKVVIDSFKSGDSITLAGPSGPGIPVVSISNEANVDTYIQAPTNFMGWNTQMFKDAARFAYAKNIRRNLSF